MRTRLKNIVRKMANGVEFSSKYGPRITYAEIEELNALGFMLQVESAHGADTSEGRIIYPLFARSFKKKARELGLYTPEGCEAL